MKLSFSCPLALVDSKGRIVAVLAGRPANDETWGPSMKKAAESMAESREAGRRSNVFPTSEDTHRRGHFVNLAVGVSFGGGQQVSDINFGDFSFCF